MSYILYELRGSRTVLREAGVKLPGPLTSLKVKRSLKALRIPRCTFAAAAADSKRELGHKHPPCQDLGGLLMDLGIKGKTALLMASTRGLGFGCAAALAAEGVRVVINGRKTEHSVNAISILGENAHFVQADVSHPAERARLFEAAQAHLGTISILVTNADGPPPGTFMNKSSEDWQSAFDIIMLSALDMIRQCIPGMIERGFGRIINISSVSAKKTTPGSPLANSLKPGLLGALGTLAREVGETGVTVNSILPGPFDTDRMRRTASGRTDISLEEAVRLYADKVPMKRLGTIEEFGALCAFLCSRQASYITGQCIVIDGGYVSTLL